MIDDITFRPNWFEHVKLIESFQHLSLTLGYNLYFVISTADSLANDLISTKYDLKNLRGLTVTDDKAYAYFVWINCDMDDILIQSTIAHEFTHVLDAVYERVGAQSVDTEIRAYMLDHLIQLAAVE